MGKEMTAAFAACRAEERPEIVSPGGDPPPAWQGTPREVFLVFLRLGLTSFGGPVAHIGFFHREIVERRKWVTDAAFADLVALCQFLPGPASSQLGFALGHLRAGMAGALGAWVGFTLPSAILMIFCAVGLSRIDAEAGWMHGLKVAAVAVVAQAVWSMAERLCPDRARVTMALACACFVLAVGSAWAQVAAIAGGLLAGWMLFRRIVPASEGVAAALDGRIPGRRVAHISLALFFVLLAASPLLAGATQNPWVQVFDGFYRAGSLIFGGGHVMLPLLEAETVGRGWLGRDTFLAGYGAAQALPGPLFAFAGYLGAAIFPDSPAWLAGGMCLIAISLPFMLLVLGALPFWERLRSQKGARAALMGANAGVVGILLAAFYNPVFVAAVDSPLAMALALAAFAALQFWKLPPWALVMLCALAGRAFL